MEYETQIDRDNEQAAMSMFAAQAHLPGTIIRCPKFYEIDYMIAENEGLGAAVLGFVEIKCRNVHSDDYYSYMISLHKVLTLRRWGRACGVPAYLAVQWSDRMGCLDVAGYPLPYAPIGVAKRHGRRPDDTEPGWFIPIGDHFMFF